MNSETESFQKRLIRHLLKVLTGQGEPFTRLLGKSENCDPVILMDALQEMETRGLIRVNDGGNEREYELTSRAKAHAGLSHGPCETTRLPESKGQRHSIVDSGFFQDIIRGVFDSLPEPGLVYSQWWFSKSTYAKLADLLFHLMKEDAHVAFAGASTLGAVFSHCVASPITIIDVDDVLLGRIASHVEKRTEFACRDISNPLDVCLKNKFDIVFADPPWSSSNLTTFFVRGSEMLLPEGKLVISFPPVFTRPSAQAERKSLLRMAEELLGLSFTRELKGFTEYSIPPFEYRAYKEHGIELNQPWRKGDVLIFKKRSKDMKCADIAVKPCWRWDQYDYGTTRLFLKRNGSVQEGPALIVPISGRHDFAYDSTSSRTYLWKQACLVSTQNQIADVSGTRHLALILRELAVKGSTGYDGRGYLKDVLPGTLAAISVLLDDPEAKNSQQGESEWHRQKERNSHAS